MFTGLIEELGTVAEFTPRAAGAELSVRCAAILSDLATGGSVAVSGVCLTAVDIRSDGFSADLAPETLERTSLGDLSPGSLVNLERPVSLQTRLGGHFVQGHVDGTGTLEALREIGDGNRELLVRVPPVLDRFLVYKGSVAIDGISLTVASIEGGILRVAIIPHTFAVTSLSTHKPGDRLNIECDILAKYVDKLLPRTLT
jgi:riboflavin synthase